MNRLIQLAALGALLTTAPHALAHGDGHAPPPPRIADCKAAVCTRDEIVAGAEQKAVPMFVKLGKLEPSWAELKALDAEERKAGAKSTEWVVRFKNEKVQDPAKQLLYVFVTAGGQLLAVNHSGR